MRLGCGRRGTNHREEIVSDIDALRECAEAGKEILLPEYGDG